MRSRICLLLALAVALPLCTGARADARAPDVRSTIDEMAHRGELTSAERTTYLRQWSRARSAARRLHGEPRWNFAGVIANTRSLARRHLLAGRLVPAFLTIERNYEWFWTDRNGTASYGARRTFGDSPLMFQFYPRSGWQIQPLGNFGRLNGLARSRHTSLATLRTYADALLGVGVQRKGFLAFEYYFPWSGGAPGWLSGMATATGAAAFARVWRRTGDARYRDAAESMLGAFFRSPPWGIRVRRGGGRAHYLLYSQTPKVLVGNGFAQSLIGLSDVHGITGSTRAKLALDRGLKGSRAAMARYDTGAWSLYWHRPGSRRGVESDLHYHQVFTGFLETLCARFPDHGFCEVHDHFVRYETEPVVIHRLRARRHRRTLRVSVWLSKRSTATLRLLKGSRTVRRTALTPRRGTHRTSWRVPARRGRYSVRVDARSLEGVRSSRSRALVVR